MERLVDGEGSFGLTPVQYAFREKQRQRELIRARRQRNRQEYRNRLFVPLRAAPADEEWHLRVHIFFRPRTLTERLLHDPLPGRSALDLRNMG